MAKYAKKPEDDDLHSEALHEFERADEAETDNRRAYEEDIEFGRECVQWPEEIKKQREREGRPCLTIPKTVAFIRQVVNDARQNKPSIKVHAIDSKADPETADILNGLIRHIEYNSNADVAYDTAGECAVSGGFGYWRIKAQYACGDSFDEDLIIERIPNPLTVYGDPDSTAADSSDWNSAFIVDRMTKEEFKAAYPKAEMVDFDAGAWSEVKSPWLDGDTVMVAEWWKREKIERTLQLMSDGTQRYKDDARDEDEEMEAEVLADAGRLKVVKERTVMSYKVTQHIVTGAGIIKSTEWKGQFIPIVPVYGDEFDVKGKRYLRSLIHYAKDAQRMLNYWRTNATELVALAPRVPFIGRKGSFDEDARWNTANSQSHSYLEYKGDVAPQRQPLDMGVAAGSIQEALNASDDMKAIIGLHDASLGARSNETSGKAIMARQKEGDVATFHFIDNVARAIRHTGRILIDLIPHYYSEARVVRVIGEDGSQRQEKINQPVPVLDKQGKPAPQMGPDGQPVLDPMTGQVLPATRIYDVTTGKYDVAVTTGPSFTTRRQEAAAEMTELLRAHPAAAPVIGDLLAKNLDWPGADEIAERLKMLVPGQQQIPPELQQAIEDGKQQLAKLTEENQKLKMDQSADLAKVESTKQIELIKLQANEAIEREKIASEERIAIAKAEIQAQATIRAAALRPAPQPAQRAA